MTDILPENAQPAEAQGAPEAQSHTPAEQAQGKGPWYDDLVKAGLEGEQLEQMDAYMRERQAHVTKIEQDAAELRKRAAAWDGVPENVMQDLAALAKDLTSTPEETFRKLTEVARAAGVDPEALLAPTNTTDTGDSQPETDVDPLYNTDDLLPPEDREVLDWARAEREQRARDAAFAEFNQFLDDLSKDSEFEGVFDKQRYIIVEAAVGRENAKAEYLRSIHPLVKLEAAQNTEPEPDLSSEPRPLTDAGSGAPDEGPSNESLFDFMLRAEHAMKAGGANS